MKLIIREYLSALKERDELDAVLPDLLSQMGMNVISRPGRGTRQDGVDVAAVGSLDGSDPQVYLFTIKPGNLTRQDWDGSVQSVRPSLNEILDVYLSNRIPIEHRDKKVVVCVCVGGDIQEQVRPNLEAYFHQNRTESLAFEEWNGDKLAALILDNFLREDLLLTNERKHLRKALAMLDEPSASFNHFKTLVGALLHDELTVQQSVMPLRQVAVCLWILFAWSRDHDNLEAAYRAAEFSLLSAWKYLARVIGEKNKDSRATLETFGAILAAYEQVSTAYLSKIIPATDHRHALSVAVQGNNNLDVNLSLFEVLGRIALRGSWASWSLQRMSDETPDNDQAIVLNSFRDCENAIRALVKNNPTLLLPVKDDQAIDICLAVFLLATDPANRTFIHEWLQEVVNRCDFALVTNGAYPCTLSSYHDLLEHPARDEDDYKERVTQGSILFPMISLISCTFGFKDIYESVRQLKADHLSHSNFQVWYPDDTSESAIYSGTANHGATLSHVSVDAAPDAFATQIFGECDESTAFGELSAISTDFWPILLIACRHHRFPIPVQFFRDSPETEGELDQHDKA